jgi:hypothetical protein
MPNPKDFKDEESFISACIPIVMKEGKTKDQAAGQCYGMWREKNNVKIIRNKKHIFKYNAKTVEGYESPEPGNLSKKGADILAEVYASCRKNGGDKEKCSKEAWSSVEKAGLK